MQRLEGMYRQTGETFVDPTAMLRLREARQDKTRFVLSLQNV